MKTIFRIICVSLLVLCAPHLRAETITHDFDALFKSTKLILTNSNKTGTTEEVEYTCGAGTERFWYDLVYSDKIAINLPNNGSEVSTSVIENLTQVRISHYPNAECTNLKVYVSTDGTSWGDPLSGDAMEYGLGTTFADIPKGNYYLKIANSSSAPFSIIEMRYTTDPSSCACLQVVSQ